MNDHEAILERLESEFALIDSRQQDYKAFGPETDLVFAELDSIRKMQLQLAAHHIAYESSSQNVWKVADPSADPSTFYQNDADALDAKTKHLHELSGQLEQLKTSMERFHDLSASMTATSTIQPAMNLEEFESVRASSPALSHRFKVPVSVASSESGSTVKHVRK